MHATSVITLLAGAVALVGNVQAAPLPRSEITGTSAEQPAAPLIVATDDDDNDDHDVDDVYQLPAIVAAIETLGSSEPAAAVTSPAPVSFLAGAILDAVGCVKGVGAVCADCVSIMGGRGPAVNASCIMTCVTAEENQPALNETCPGIDFVQFGTCHATLKDTCGQCAPEVMQGEIFGLHLLDVDDDDDCFEDCYWANKDAIRAACPLPEPLNKMYQCHQQLAQTCGECVESDDDHDIDRECLDKCYATHQSTLADACPADMMENLGEVMTLFGNDDDDDSLAMQQLIKEVLGGLGLPAEVLSLLPFDLSDFLDDVADGEVDLVALFGTMAANGTPDLQGLIDAIVATQQDDDDDADDGSDDSAQQQDDDEDDDLEGASVATQQGQGDDDDQDDDDRDDASVATQQDDDQDDDDHDDDVDDVANVATQQDLDDDDQDDDDRDDAIVATQQDQGDDDDQDDDDVDDASVAMQQDDDQDDDGDDDSDDGDA